jgi:hypothetical protein
LASPFSLSAKALSRMRKPHGYWLAGLLSNIKNWQWAGMSSVAVALLVMLMVREQLPEEPVWLDSDVKEIAQNTAPAPEKALNEERADAAEYSAANPAAEVPTPVARAQEKAKGEAPAAAPVLADKDNEAIAAAPTAAAPPAPAEQVLARQDEGVAAESRERLETAPTVSAPASDVVAALPEQKDPAAKPAATAKKSVMLEDASALEFAKTQGAAKAKQDIQAGVLRILHFASDWPADKALLDEATGYRVELLKDHVMAPDALAAYNQTMRDWFQAQH